MTHSKRVQMFSVACCSVTDVQTINLRYGDIHTETTLTPTEDEIVTNRQTEGKISALQLTVVFPAERQYGI